MALTDEIKSMMDEVISLQDEIKIVDAQMAPYKTRRKELTQRKKQLLSDVCGELDTVVGYRNFHFGSISARKTKYTKQNIINHLSPEQHEQYVETYSELEHKPIFTPLKRQRSD